MKLKVFSLFLLAILSINAFAGDEESALIKCEAVYENCIASCEENDETCIQNCDSLYSKCLQDNGIEDSVEP